MYFAEAFSLAVGNLRHKCTDGEYGQRVCYINHDEVIFMSKSLETVNNFVESNSCDWQEGGYFNQVCVYEINENTYGCPVNIISITGANGSWEKLVEENNKDDFFLKYTSFKDNLDYILKTPFGLSSFRDYHLLPFFCLRLE